MGRRHSLTLLIIAVLIIFSVVVLAQYQIFSREGMSLGLDLRGGTHLVYEADFSDIQPGTESDAMAVARGIIEKRINRYGVSEPNVQTLGSDRISVQIPGVTAEESKSLVGAVAELDFRELKGASTGLLAAANVGDTNVTVADATGFEVGDTLVIGLSAAGSIGKPSWEAKQITAIEGDNFSLDSGMYYQHQAGEPVSAWIPATGTIDDEVIHLTGKYLLPNSYINIDQQTNQPVVAFEFNEIGARLFAQITARLLDQPLGIFLDRDIISAPTVKAQISDKGIIEGLTYEEARILSSQLNGGALPLPLGHWVDEEFIIGEPAVIQSVDATLGADSLSKSLVAGIIGLILVMVFMIAYYRLSGLLACFSLLIYGSIMLTIFKLVPVTLTLAHIAAFILSIGMAVDANVLIFERMKEEMRSGKTLGASIETGFSRAWPAIRDSNFSTLITCIILFWFGSQIVAAPLVMGFALTLGIGVVVSMFSAIVVTKSFLRTILYTPLARKAILFRQ